jgi:hypothetical protein
MPKARSLVAAFATVLLTVGGLVVASLPTACNAFCMYTDSDQSRDRSACESMHGQWVTDRCGEGSCVGGVYPPAPSSTTTCTYEDCRVDSGVGCHIVRCQGPVDVDAGDAGLDAGDAD